MALHLDWRIGEFIETGLGMRNLPVAVIKKAEQHFKDEADKWYIRKVMADYLDFKRKWVYCMEHGHNYKLYSANITPESGSETLICKRCGAYEEIIYY